MEIAKDTLVKLTYTLRFDKADGEIIEEIGEKDAMEIVVGHDVLLESFEAKILGLKAGDTFAFSLSPQEAYPKKRPKTYTKATSSRLWMPTKRPMRR